MEDRAHVLQAEAVLVQRHGVQVDAHGGQGPAGDEHLAHPAHLRELLLQNRRRRVEHPPATHDVRRQREDEDGGVGGIDLAIGGIARKIGRQVAARRIDRRLDVPRRAVDVPRELELQHDVRGAEIARGGHLGHRRDVAELALERRGHRRRHRLRVGARQLGGDLDGGEIDLGQRRHRQECEGQRAGQREGDGE